MVASDDQPRTVEQAAAELNLSRATIRAWIAQRRLGHVRLGRANPNPSRGDSEGAGGRLRAARAQPATWPGN